MKCKKCDNHSQECQNKDDNGNACFDCEAPTGNSCGTTEQDYLDENNDTIPFAILEKAEQELHNGHKMGGCYDCRNGNYN